MCNGVFCVTWNEIPYRSADWDLRQEHERGDATQFPHFIITTPPPPTFFEAKTSEESIGSADAANRRTSVSKERETSLRKTNVEGARADFGRSPVSLENAG